MELVNTRNTARPKQQPAHANKVKEKNDKQRVPEFAAEKICAFPEVHPPKRIPEVAPSAMNHQQKSLVGTPKYVRQCRAVPQAAQDHHSHQVHISARLSSAVASEWNVEIIAQPGGQRDVPVPPEIRRIGDEIRRAEIDWQFEAHNFGQAARNVRVARKVSID